MVMAYVSLSLLKGKCKVATRENLSRADTELDSPLIPQILELR